MSNICKTVSLRTRKIKDGHMLSYYLDYYPGYRDESTMKVIRHESLGIYIYAKPKNQMEHKYNLNLTARAEAIRCRRFEAIVNERYDFFDKEKMKGDFLAYFKRLADKKNSKWQHVYMHFRTFTQGKCTFGEINVDLCNRFREYLLTAPQGLHKNRKLHINSAANYWSTFLSSILPLLPCQCTPFALQMYPFCIPIVLHLKRNSTVNGVQLYSFCCKIESF